MKTVPPRSLTHAPEIRGTVAAILIVTAGGLSAVFLKQNQNLNLVRTENARLLKEKVELTAQLKHARHAQRTNTNLAELQELAERHADRAEKNCGRFARSDVVLNIMEKTTMRHLSKGDYSATEFFKKAEAANVLVVPALDINEPREPKVSNRVTIIASYTATPDQPYHGVLSANFRDFLFNDTLKDRMHELADDNFDTMGQTLIVYRQDYRVLTRMVAKPENGFVIEASATERDVRDFKFRQGPNPCK